MKMTEIDVTGEEKESKGEGGCLAGEEHENNGGDERVEASLAHLELNRVYLD